MAQVRRRLPSRRVLHGGRVTPYLSRRQGLGWDLESRWFHTLGCRGSIVAVFDPGGVVAGNLFDRAMPFSTRHSGELRVGMEWGMGQRVLKKADRDSPRNSTPVSTWAARAIAVHPVRLRLQFPNSAPTVPAEVASPSAASGRARPQRRAGPQRRPPPPRTGLEPASQARFRRLGSSRSPSESPNIGGVGTGLAGSSRRRRLGG